MNPEGDWRDEYETRLEAYVDARRNVRSAEFRANLSRYVIYANVGPVTILMRNAGRRAVLVSPAFYERAVHTMGREDRRRKEEARKAEERLGRPETAMERNGRLMRQAAQDGVPLDRPDFDAMWDNRWFG